MIKRQRNRPRKTSEYGLGCTQELILNVNGIYLNNGFSTDWGFNFGDRNMQKPEKLKRRKGRVSYFRLLSDFAGTALLFCKRRSAILLMFILRMTSLFLTSRMVSFRFGKVYICDIWNVLDARQTKRPVSICERYDHSFSRKAFTLLVKRKMKQIYWRDLT